MKKTLIAAMTILVFIGMTGFAFSQVKIGVINPQKLIEQTKRGRQTVSKLENIGKGKQDQLNAMQAEIKKLQKELMSPALNNAAKEKKSLELQNKQTAAKRFIEDTQKEMQVLMNKEMISLNNEIQPIIKQFGKENGFTIILELRSPSAYFEPTVLYFDPAVDITDDIIKIMDGKNK